MRASERIQSFDLTGPAGPLESLLHFDLERRPARSAVVCHPHPLFGGTMHNKVVHRIDRALFAAGATVLRFNFRGVGASAGRYDEGIGERADALAAVEAMWAREPGLPLILGGFSFGAGRALEVGLADPRVERVIAVGTAPSIADALPDALPKPVLFLHAGEDELAPIEPTRRRVAALSGPVQWIEIPGADHFFTRALDALEPAVRSWLEIG